MVDTKRLELGIYEDIPHLITPVVTEAKKGNNALRWTVMEMERRYKLLAGVSVRNLQQYNKALNLNEMVKETYRVLARPGETAVDGQRRLFRLIELYRSDPDGMFDKLYKEFSSPVAIQAEFLGGLRGWIDTHVPDPE